MYSWIWKKLPFGLPGKVAGSLALSLGTVALLWYVVFPAVRPHMPWSNIETGVDGDTEQTQDAGEESATCTPGVDCQDTQFDPEEWETAESPTGEESGGDG